MSIERDPIVPPQDVSSRMRTLSTAMYNHAIDTGIIAPPSDCERCGKPAPSIHGHHWDYARPLEVEWLCHDCHNREHREIHKETREQNLLDILTPAMERVLDKIEELIGEGKHPSAVAIAKRLGVTPNAAVVAINRLELGEWIERGPYMRGLSRECRLTPKAENRKAVA